MIEIITGNLLNVDVDIIAHQVNCKGVMNLGVAKSIKDKYPKVYSEYIAVPRSEMRLGKVQIVDVEDCKVANLFMQNRYGTDPNEIYTKYRAMRRAMMTLIMYMKENNLKTVAMPYNIGCGFGNGDWEVVYGILKKYFEGRKKITLYLVKLEYCHE